MKRFYLYPLYYLNKKAFSHNLLAAHNSNDKFQFKHVELIKEFTGCPTNKVIKAISSKLELQLLSEEDMLKRLAIINKMELYDSKTLNILQLLVKHHLTLKNHHAALCEYSFIPCLVSAFHVKRFNSLSRYSVKDLKVRGFIEKKADVLKTLWKHAQLDINKCPEVSEDESLHSLKETALKEYLKEKLNVPEVEIERQQQELNLRLLNKSFKHINKNLDIFQNIIKLSNTRIFSNWYVLSVDSDNTMEILRQFPLIGSSEMKVCLHVYPKIATMPVENITKMTEYFLEADVPIKALGRFPHLLTLNCETVKDRLKELREIEYFSVYNNHPSVAKLLHYQVKAKHRLSILQDLKITCSLHHLLCREKIFERICEFGNRITGSDSIYYLEAELNLNKDDIIRKLKRHKRWNYVPVVDIAKNLQYLRKTFTDDEIKKNIYILFYYNGKLLHEMEKLESKEELEGFKNNGEIKKEFILPLVIYFLEKETNFTGESIWETCLSNPYQDLPDDSENKIISV